MDDEHNPLKSHEILTYLAHVISPLHLPEKEILEDRQDQKAACNPTVMTDQRTINEHWNHLMEVSTGQDIHTVSKYHWTDT